MELLPVDGRSGRAGRSTRTRVWVSTPGFSLPTSSARRQQLSRAPAQRGKRCPGCGCWWSSSRCGRRPSSWRVTCRWPSWRSRCQWPCWERRTWGWSTGDWWSRTLMAPAHSSRGGRISAAWCPAALPVLSEPETDLKRLVLEYNSDNHTRYRT